ERFTSLVHLRDGDGPAPLVETLAEQASAATAHIDTRAAFPLHRAVSTAGAGITLVALLLAPLLFSDAYESFFSRLFGALTAAWHGYQLRVTPGDHAFLQGRAVELTASAEVFHPSARLPAECWLVTADEAGQETRTPMPRKGDRFVQEARDV